MLLPHVPPPIAPNHQQPIRQIMQRRAQRVKNMSTKGATRLQVFSDARKSDPGKLLASCTCTPVKITLLVVTLKSHDKEGARSESNKQTKISAGSACIHSILYIWAVATCLAAASNILSSVGHTIRGASDGRASSNGGCNLRNTAGEWIQSFFI